MYFQQEIKFWLIHLCFKDVWFICIFTTCSPFLFCNHLEYLPVQFSSRLLFWLATLVFMFPATLFVSTGQVIVLICICKFKSSVLLFWRNSVFRFFLVNSECDVYLQVDHSLVCGYSKMFLLFFIFPGFINRFLFAFYSWI